MEGRVASKVYADGNEIDYTYENNTSRLSAMADANGNITTYSYNLDNTLASTTYTPASGVSATPTVSFVYDSVYNRVTSMTDGTGTTTYSYYPITGSVTTGAGRLASSSVPIAGSTAAVTYSYDALGRVTGHSVDTATTNANNVSAAFDTLGRVTNVTNALGAFTYAYLDQTSRASSVTYPSGTGLSTAYSYFNNAGDQRLQEIKNLAGSNVLSDFQYTYNPVGTIATWQQQADSNTPTSYALTYDAADQLINAVQTNTSTSATVSSNAYNYDPAGNRLAETTLAGTTGGQFDNLNQLTRYSSVSGTQTVAGNTSAAVTNVTVNAITATVTESTNFTASVPLQPGTNTVSVVAQPSSGATTTQRYQVVTSGTSPTALTYDDNGNTLTDENGNSYQWDGLNRLTKITYPSGASSLFAYDGLSRRIQIVERNSSGTITSTKNYLWIGQDIAEERDASNTVTKRFFPQGEQQSGTNYYYTRDHEGSVRELCSSTGTIVSRMAYDPYGRTTTVSGTILPTKQYARYYAHMASGLYLTKYRAYDPNTGTWLSRDPMGERGGLNLYDYVEDDPINATDFLGLSCNWVLSVGHGKVLGTYPKPAPPNTNNSYYEQHGNQCTGYIGCGANSLNSGGLGQDFAQNKHTDDRAPDQGSDVAEENSQLSARILTALSQLEKKAGDACKTGACKGDITITIICQTNGGHYGDDPISIDIAPGICGKTETIRCPCTTLATRTK